MTRKRVVVTGLGTINALGHDCDAYWCKLCAGTSGFRPLSDIDSRTLRFKSGAQVESFKPETVLGLKQLKLLDRVSQFALVAAHESVRNSGLQWKGRRNNRFGVVMGASFGHNTLDRGFLDLYASNRPRLHPLTIPRVMPNASASCISIEYGITGPTFTVSTACSSSNHAIGQAFWMVRNGIVDCAITGGSDAPFSFGNLKAWDALRVVSPDVCRPFSKNRNGMLLGEGAGVIVIESLPHAQARGAKILAEIAGFGMSADAHRMVQPSVDGPVDAIEAALNDAAIMPPQIDYINAHGTGTLANDKMETAAIRRVFGKHAERLPVSSTKSMHGHGLCAAGALEAVATVLTLRHGILPPTANYSAADPECDLDVVANQARECSPQYAMSNSFAFGGLNAVLVFRRWNN